MVSMVMFVLTIMCVCAFRIDSMDNILHFANTLIILIIIYSVHDVC